MMAIRGRTRDARSSSHLLFMCQAKVDGHPSISKSPGIAIQIIPVSLIGHFPKPAGQDVTYPNRLSYQALLPDFVPCGYACSFCAPSIGGRKRIPSELKGVPSD